MSKLAITKMQDTLSLEIVDFALNYAKEFGWAVFPLHSITPDGFCTCGQASCKSEGKHPRTKQGSLDASADPAVIEAWFADPDLPESNIGVATGKISDLVVVDVDTDKGAEISDLVFGDLDYTIFNTPKVKTGRGLHFYYKLPAGVTVKNSASRLGQLSTFAAMAVTWLPRHQSISPDATISS